MKAKTLQILIIVLLFISGCNFPTISRPQSAIIAAPTNTARAETQEAAETEAVETEAAETEMVLIAEPSSTLAPNLEPTPTPINLPPRTCSEPTGTLLYLAMQGDDGGKDILTIKPDGTDFKDISDGGYVEQFLIPHPNGNRFLYQNNLTYFFTRDMEGYNRIQLTERIAFPDEVKYSPDGSKIAYLAYLGKTHHIYIMDADGTSMFTLTDFTAYMDLDNNFDYPTDVFSFDWSPSSSHIIFEAELNSQRDVFIAEADGGNLFNLTNTPDLNEYGPTYSPNGTHIAYTAGDSNSTDLHMMKSDGTEQYRIIDLKGHSSSPSWSGDSYQIAFISDHDGDEEVYVVDPDGEDFAQLTHNETREYWLQWSPDSCWLAYRSVVNADGISEIFRATPDGVDTFQITQQNSWILRFYWVDN